jgi:homoserine kinase type II
MDDIFEVIKAHCGTFIFTSVEPLKSAGGLSGALFWRLNSPAGPLILRRWPAEHPSPTRLRFIHGMLRHAWSRGISFVPVPVETKSGGSFVLRGGFLWELDPWMPGQADYHAAPKAEKLGAAMNALATFHLAVADFQADLQALTAAGDGHELAHSAHPPPIARRHESLIALGRELGLFRSSVTRDFSANLAPLAYEALDVLPKALPHVLAKIEPFVGAELPLQVCLRDIRHDHVLFTGNAVTGIIDFGAVDWDTPAADVARLVGSLVGDDLSSRERALAAYGETRPLSPDERRAVDALDACGTVLALGNWMRWIYVEGRSFENEGQIVSRFAGLLERARRL